MIGNIQPKLRTVFIWCNSPVVAGVGGGVSTKYCTVMSTGVAYILANYYIWTVRPGLIGAVSKMIGSSSDMAIVSALIVAMNNVSDSIFDCSDTLIRY